MGMNISDFFDMDVLIQMGLRRLWDFPSCRFP